MYVRVFNNNSETFTVTPSVVVNNEFYLLRNFIAMLNKMLCFVYLWIWVPRIAVIKISLIFLSLLFQCFIHTAINWNARYYTYYYIMILTTIWYLLLYDTYYYIWLYIIFIIIWQFQYSPRHKDCFGLTDGEVVERLWAYLRKYAKATKEMRPSHRIDVLTDALLHYSKTSAQRLGKFLYH